jgi:hypothetical protein
VDSFSLVEDEMIFSTPRPDEQEGDHETIQGFIVLHPCVAFGLCGGVTSKEDLGRRIRQLLDR